MKNEPHDLPADRDSQKSEVSDLEHQIEDLRAELESLVHELDHRRHEAFDVRLQLRRHAPAVAVVAGSLALIVAGPIWLARRRRAPHPLARALRVARALAIAAALIPSARRASRA
jgi:hypothetical protein